MGPAPPQWLLEPMGIAPPQWLTQFIGNVHQIQATNSNSPTRSTIAGLNPGQLDAYCDGYVGVGHGLVGAAGQTAIAQVAAFFMSSTQEKLQLCKEQHEKEHLK
ncbi:hypothetical protein F5887DRAFT_920035 [Amanita rubescens]|nr:hypothetical protein F5887DRAFT_920035 [Amanita rubescens]